MPAYYNEIDPYAAQWLRNLIAAGHIAPGVVDERSIEDVHPSDLRGFEQCHFFAGIGVWSLALRRAGQPDDRPVWTGSCPCQPFSAAGAGAGFDDERHLWPHFHWLIQECRPAVVFGEQVASRDADPWIDLVQDDLEGLGYGVAAVPFPSADVGAPHIRDRLYWVAHATNQRQHWRRASEARDGRDATRVEFERLRDAGGLANAHQHGRTALPLDGLHDAEHHAQPCGESGGLANAKCWDAAELTRQRPGPRTQEGAGSPGEPEGCRSLPDPRHAGPTNGRWAAADWLLCRDGKWRPVEPGTFPLVDGAPSRVGRLRAYGNAINAVQAETFIRCVMPDL